MTPETYARARLDVACHLNVLLPDASPEGLPAALDSIAAAGYSRVVLPPLDPSATDAALLGRLLSERGLAPITIAGQDAGADVSSSDADERAAGAARLRSIVELTAALGGDQLNGVPYGRFGAPGVPTSHDVVQRSALEVGRVAEYAHSKGIMMTFEVLNRYETSLLNTAAQAVAFVELSESEHLRIHLDTFHMAIEEPDIAAAIRAALPKLGYLELGQSGRGRLSTGVVDLEEVVRAALDDGYEGRWGVEAFTRSVLPAPVADMLAIWRSPYDDGAELAADAIGVIDRGWSRSAAGQRSLQSDRASR